MSTMAPDVSKPATAATSRTGTRRRRKLLLIPLSLLCALALVLGYLFLTAKPEASTALGASAVIPGGTARINGVIPLEKDGWLPPERVQVLDEGPSAGTHRVRILVQFTALEGEGTTLDTSQFSVTGLGANSIHPLWTAPAKAELQQGDTADATMVFELPNQAIALVLEGPGNTRLSLGLSHHTS
ncbi:hypothetical protein [Arthrobacter sp. AFG20]|uniref:hypothetical protein n=1 Tax=Arthrobacter sp. AFG20 TaxID=1688671 RepID=UPI002155288C|nr:hypothetical protein [Arthrobacter sp. AFG20]